MKIVTSIAQEIKISVTHQREVLFKQRNLLLAFDLYNITWLGVLPTLLSFVLIEAFHDCGPEIAESRKFFPR